MARNRLKKGEMQATKKPTRVGFFIELVLLTSSWSQQQEQQLARKQQEQQLVQKRQQQEQQEQQELQQLACRKRTETEPTEQRSERSVSFY